MKNTLKMLVSTALLLAFAVPIQSTAAHWHGPGYTHGPHYAPGFYHPWHGHGYGRGYGRGYGGLSGGFGFSARGGSYGRGWGRGYGRPYHGFHPHRGYWRAPAAMHNQVAPQSPSAEGGSY